MIRVILLYISSAESSSLICPLSVGFNKIDINIACIIVLFEIIDNVSFADQPCALYQQTGLIFIVFPFDKSVIKLSFKHNHTSAGYIIPYYIRVANKNAYFKSHSKWLLHIFVICKETKMHIFYCWRHDKIFAKKMWKRLKFQIYRILRRLFILFLSYVQPIRNPQQAHTALQFGVQRCL